MKYTFGSANLEELQRYNARVIPRVDIETMKDHPALQGQSFDRIVYNFHRAVFASYEYPDEQLMKNVFLMNSYFRNAAHMLSPEGEVHVTNTTTFPCNQWGLKGIAYGNRLKLLGTDEFHVKDYPVYQPTRGRKTNPEEPYPTSPAST